MTVALTRTKAEQGVCEQFEAAAGEFAGRRLGGHARREAIGTFAARGLPHRRIEEFKYTDLRERLQEIPPPALPASRAMTAEQLRAALGPLASIASTRIVLVDGRYREALSDAGCREGIERRFRSASSSRRRRHGSSASSRRTASAATTARVALNTRLHDRRRRDQGQRGRGAARPTP